MTKLAGGHNEAENTFAMENFVERTLFFNRFSCDYETYSLCTFVEGKHFGEVKLWLTLCFKREMSLTIIICRTFSPTNTDNGQLSVMYQ